MEQHSEVDLRTRLLRKVQSLHKSEKYEELSEVLLYAARVLNDLSSVEHELFIYTNKKLAQDQVSAWHFINNKKFKKHLNMERPEAKNIKKLIINRLRALCGDVFRVVDERILPQTTNRICKIRFYEFKGDLNRYLAEVETGLTRQFVVLNSLKSYELATQIVTYSLPKSHPFHQKIIDQYDNFIDNYLDQPLKTCLNAKNLFEEMRTEVNCIFRRNTKACQTNINSYSIDDWPDSFKKFKDNSPKN